MVRSMVAALVQARFATPGLSRLVRAVLDCVLSTAIFADSV